MQLLTQIVKLHGKTIENEYFREAKGWEKKGPVRENNSICGKVSEFNGRIILFKNYPDISVLPNHVTPLEIQTQSWPSLCQDLTPEPHQLVEFTTYSSLFSTTLRWVLLPLLFTSWLHLVSFSGCAEHQIEEFQEPTGQSHPIWSW